MKALNQDTFNRVLNQAKNKQPDFTQTKPARIWTETVDDHVEVGTKAKVEGMEAVVHKVTNKTINGKTTYHLELHSIETVEVPR